MRRSILLHSVERLLEPGEKLEDAAFMWARHRLGYAYAAGAFVALVIVAIASGFEPWPSRIVIGIAGATVALSATTNYRVLALTTSNLVVLDAGRLRQVARRVKRRLPRGAAVTIVRDTMITTDWLVDGAEYTVPKGSQRAMERIAALQAGR
jgi:hypothetical protein